MKSPSYHSFWQICWHGIWALFFILLPITSMPFVIRLVRSDVVAAPSGLLLALILPIGGLILVRKGGALPPNAVIFLIFVLVCTALTFVSFFYPIPVFKNSSPIRSAFTALLTLFAGAGFYFSALLWAQAEDRTRFALRLINLSGAVMLGWTLAQAVAWYGMNRYPEWMKTVQFFFSAGSLYRQRFVGFAMEPSWLAHQLNLLYLPIWFGAAVTGYSAHRTHWKTITVERVLFLVGFIVLFLTLSRVGLFACLSAIFVFCIGKLLSTKKMRNPWVALGSLGATLLILLGFLWLLSRLDHRMAAIFQLNWRGRENPFYFIAEKISLASRFVYWESGLKIYSRYPLTGVGLGHGGFFMPEALSPFALQLTEVRRLLFHSNTLLNIKSLWIRLLAETGTIGFSFFIVWYGAAARTFFHMRKNTNLQIKALCYAGLFALIAFVLEGFSVDTFALPYFWVMMGLVSGCVTLPKGACKR